jgi:membrane associated rhomboid family serine protease
MLTKIIMVNIFVFVIIRLIIAFTGHINIGAPIDEHPIIDWLAVPSDFISILKKPWTLITHMFLHVGFFHIIWNMLLLYWFARIIGDLLGDARVLPLYIMGGLAGVAMYLMADHLLPIGTDGNSIAMGASAAVMTFIFAAATLSPDYTMRLLIIGYVKIKYIAAFVLFLDLLGTAGTNSGGHFGHLGGAILGALFTYQLQQGVDITEGFQSLKKFFAFSNDKTPKNKKSPIKIVYRNPSKAEHRSDTQSDFQTNLDSILDKINREGIESLSLEEKTFLEEASKKK